MCCSADKEETGDWKLEIGDCPPPVPSLQSLVSIFLLGLILTSCNSVAPVIKIGLVGPFEGAQRQIGYDVIYSARLAVREINTAGGIGGYWVALVALDDSGEVDLAQAAAESLTLDANVVAVVGHWLPQTTAAAAPIYAHAGLAFLPMGTAPFTTTNPTHLPADFHTAYEAVTPFDETAGEYAGSAYDAFQLLWLALGEVDGRITRESVAGALLGLEYEGMTGVVYQKRDD